MMDAEFNTSIELFHKTAAKAKQNFLRNPKPRQLGGNKDGKKRSQRPHRDRKGSLRTVFLAFDLDGGSDIGFEELLVLGQARRKLGQKSGDWTEERNKELMRKMGGSQETGVQMPRFVDHFDEILPGDPVEFDT